MITESDPKVGAVTSNQWCRGTGSQVTCDQEAPAGSDPRIGTLSTGKWCTSNGSNINCTADAPSGGGTPTGAVMAFDLTACPTGWTEYEPARGRFLRGIDPTGTNDPDGVRAAGSVQADEFKAHTHSQTQNMYHYSQNMGGGFNGNYSEWLFGYTGSAGGAETRPKNVAVIFCEYIGSGGLGGGGGGGITGYQLVTNTIPVGAAIAWNFAVCPSGKKVLGGSCTTGHGGQPTNTSISGNGFGCYVANDLRPVSSSIFG